MDHESLIILVGQGKRENHHDEFVLVLCKPSTENLRGLTPSSLLRAPPTNSGEFLESRNNRVAEYFCLKTGILKRGLPASNLWSARLVENKRS